MSLGRFSVFFSTGVAISGFAMTRMWKHQRDLNCCSCLEEQGQGIHQSNTKDVPDIRFKMLSSQVFMRHGARTPLFHIPGVKEVIYDHNFLIGGEDAEIDRAARAPHTDVPISIQDENGGPRPRSLADENYRKTKFKGGLRAGVLTSVGRNQAFNEGLRLRQKYMNHYHILSSDFKRNEIVTRSTNIDRTIDTIQSVLAGLYGKEAFKEPVVIDVMNFKDEFLFPNSYTCQPFMKDHKYVSANINSDVNVRGVVKKLKAHVGESEDIDIMSWRDNIAARQVHGLHVPQFMLDLHEEIDKAATFVLHSYMCGYQKNMLGPSVGLLLDTVKCNLDNTSKTNHTSPKVYLYACHDSTLAPLLESLGLFDGEWPPYCAAVEFDLFEDPRHEKFVRVSYLEKAMTLPGESDTMIPLSRFNKILSKYSRTREQLQQECQVVEEAKEQIMSSKKV